jgi:hypothetical protein
MYLLHASFGHACIEMYRDSWHIALLVKKLSLNLIHMVYIRLLFFLVYLGGISIEFVLSFPRTQKGEIIFLLLGIGFLRWHTLFLVTRVMMICLLLIRSFVKLFVYMV